MIQKTMETGGTGRVKLLTVSDRVYGMSNH